MPSGMSVQVVAAAPSRADAPNPADTRWPAITHEQRDWEPKFDTGRLADMITKTYKPAVPPDIAGLTVNIDADTAAICRSRSRDAASHMKPEVGHPFPVRTIRTFVARRTDVARVKRSSTRPPTDVAPH